MSDIACIYEMNMIDENEQLEQDILSGKGMEVLFCLMEQRSTGQEIARRLEMPNYSIQLYLQRLVKAGLVKVEKTVVVNGQIEKYYGLVSDDIEIMNRLKNKALSGEERKRKAEITAQHFAMMVRNAIRNVDETENAPHKIKAYFMKAKKEDMEEFKGSVDEFFQKYKALENPDAQDTYSLFTVLAPYEMEE